MFQGKYFGFYLAPPIRRTALDYLETSPISYFYIKENSCPSIYFKVGPLSTNVVIILTVNITHL